MQLKMMVLVFIMAVRRTKYRDACNWDNEANTDDGLVLMQQKNYDCNGDCLADSDGDNICDELELPGCIDDSACNLMVRQQMMMAHVILQKLIMIAMVIVS